MTSPDPARDVTRHELPQADRMFIDGGWVTPSSSVTAAVLDPVTEQEIARVALGDADDVDRAVKAAAAAFPAFSTTTVEQRIDLLERIVLEYMARADDFADALCAEIGAPRPLAARSHVHAGAWQIACALDALREGFPFSETIAGSTVIREPIGVCALIAPWNWPLHQIGAKVGPALAAGCTVVLKPSEVAPLTGVILAEVMAAAGVAKGVFNLVQGDGPTVGAGLSAHPLVDMVSFTGSTRAGIEVARAAAPTVKRVTQELGGKSANIILGDVDLDAVLRRDVAEAFTNSGQSCDAWTRILVPFDRMDEAARIAGDVADSLHLGAPDDASTTMGPVVSQAQYDRVQKYIQLGVDEGARLVAGGLGKPAGLETGYFVRPTVFADATNGMTICRDEIFGPVVTLIGYEHEDQAVEIANDSVYGLSARVSSADTARAHAIAARLRAGMVLINGAELDGGAPFGGYKQSGNGREFGAIGMLEYLESKTVRDGSETGAPRNHAWFMQEVDRMSGAHTSQD